MAYPHPIKHTYIVDVGPREACIYGDFNSFGRKIVDFQPKWWVYRAFSLCFEPVLPEMTKIGSKPGNPTGGGIPSLILLGFSQFWSKSAKKPQKTQNRLKIARGRGVWGVTPTNAGRCSAGPGGPAECRARSEMVTSRLLSHPRGDFYRFYDISSLFGQGPKNGSEIQ